MKGLLFDNWPQKLASVAIAVLLWQIVSRLEQSTDRKWLEVPVRAVNEPEGLFVTDGPRIIRVEATSLGPSLDEIDESEFVAEVDLTGAAPGRKVFPVKLKYPSRINAVARLRGPERVTMTLEYFTEKDIPVDVEFIGTRSDDLRVDTFSIDPRRVRISGQKSRLDQATTARVTVDVRRINQGEALQPLVAILDQYDRPLNVTVDPQRVTFRANLVAAPPKKNVLVQPAWRGSPQFGYRVDRYEVTPSVVEVTGRPDILNTLATVDTSPVDITNISATSTFTVSILPPEGVTTDVAEVQVRVFLRKEGDQPSP